jgi:hypothetical protein
MAPVYEVLKGGDPVATCEKYGISREELDKRLEAFQASRRQMALEQNLFSGKVGRNDPCPCGSGKKFKKCCLSRMEETRRQIPADQLAEMEQKEKAREKLEKEVRKGFEMLFAQDFAKAGRFAALLLESYPEDDRLHDIVATVRLATGDYDGAFHVCRGRWQIAREEKLFYQENGYHKREGLDRSAPVHFYSPSTWLDKFWIAQRARAFRDRYPVGNDPNLLKMIDALETANDLKRFPATQEAGFEVRRQALAPVLSRLEEQGTAAIPYLLPLCYTFSWASLFVPDLLRSCGTDECIRLLAELAMFRFPYFSQKCLQNIESFGERALPQLEAALDEDRAFDELKVGLLAVLGNIPTQDSFRVLAGFTEHESPYLVNSAMQALERHGNPAAQPYLDKARQRLKEFDSIAGAIEEVAGSGV